MPNVLLAVYRNRVLRVNFLDVMSFLVLGLVANPAQSETTLEIVILKMVKVRIVGRMETCQKSFSVRFAVLTIYQCLIKKMEYVTEWIRRMLLCVVYRDMVSNLDIWVINDCSTLSITACSLVDCPCSSALHIELLYA